MTADDRRYLEVKAELRKVEARLEKSKRAYIAAATAAGKYDRRLQAHKEIQQVLRETARKRDEAEEYERAVEALARAK